MKKIYTFLFCLVLCFIFGIETQAQQDAQFIGYRQNGLVYNPAYAGTRDVGSLMAYYRAQWINIDDSTPRTFNLSLHGPLSGKNPQLRKVGLGITLQNDRINIHNRTQINTAYSYKLEGIGPGTLSLGLQISILNLQSAFSALANTEAGDILLSEDVNRWTGNFGVGGYYYTDQFYVGMSVPNIIQNKLIPDNENSVWQSHYYFTTGGVIDLNTRGLKLRPSVLVKKTADAPFSADLSMSVVIDNSLSVGMAYRFAESIDFFADYQINRNFLIGYGFDFTTTKLASFGSSHDIYLRYEFGFNKERVVTPRFF